MEFVKNEWENILIQTIKIAVDDLNNRVKGW